MEIKYFSYPRISVQQATRIWSEIRSLSLAEVRQRCDNVSVTGTEFYPFAQVRANDGELREVRKQIIDVAIRHGYPNPVTARQKVAFESDLLELFHNEINMSPAEASHMDVWHFFNVKYLADITLWRFGSLSNYDSHWTISPDRIFAFNRNMFGRIWWRNHLLGPELVARLGEDATVAIVERPALFAYPPFARGVGERTLATVTNFSPSQILRPATILFSRRMAVLSPYAMDAEQMQNFVDGVITEAEKSILIDEEKS